MPHIASLGSTQKQLFCKNQPDFPVSTGRTAIFGPFLSADAFERVRQRNNTHIKAPTIFLKEADSE